MIRRPPRSTLFPSTPLSRSARTAAARHPPKSARPCRSGSIPLAPASRRSEEHTSELQSQSNLVCRLLLEKKKHEPDHHPHTERDASGPHMYHQHLLGSIPA